MSEPRDEKLAHICKLAVVVAHTFSQPRDEWMDSMRKADNEELFNTFSALSILSEAFLALLDAHPELRPAFRVPARQSTREE